MIALRRVARGENAIDFRRWWRAGLVVSLLLVVVSVGSLATRGLNLGIDFVGGTSWEVVADVSVAEAREVLEPLGEGGAKIQTVSPPGGATVLRVQSGLDDPTRQGEVTAVLAELGGVEVAAVSVSTVGPSWGAEITRSALRALIVFLIVLAIYLSIRLEWEMAIAAIVSLFHDLLISVGVYSLFQFEVTPATVIAFLTILGYSIYDTVIVFDRVKDNTPLVGTSGGYTYSGMASLSMNQVLMRSVNTTVSSLLPVVSLLVVGSWLLGALTLQEFGVALLVGMLLGAYSSIFVAAPVLCMLKERQPRNRVVRERLQANRPKAPVEVAPHAAPQSADPVPRSEVSDAPAAKPAAPRSPSSPIPPRPRKRPKRR